MFHKILHLLSPPPVPGSVMFESCRGLLEARHVLDATGCLLRAFRHGWRPQQVVSVVGQYTALRLMNESLWTPARLYEHLNHSKPGTGMRDGK